VPPFLLALLYGGGYLAQFMRNYTAWKSMGGSPGDGTSPAMPSLSFTSCLEAFFSFPYGIIGIAVCLGLLALLVIMVMRMGYSDSGEYDEERNFIYSRKGTYGTAGFMTKQEMQGVLDLASDIRHHTGTILGILDRQVVCIPKDTRLNGNIAVYGASGSMKTRAFCVNRILQSAARGESLIICDPKSELYEKTSRYLVEEKKYTVKVFNLVMPENSDSWNCLAEIEGDELMAQLFCDVIIKNTGSERGDHFWDAAEMNLLKALVLYVEQGFPPENKNIGQVYKLLTLNAEKELNSLFDMLPPSHPAKAPYALFKQASETVRSGVIIGLGSRLQVFQNKMICQITSHDEIDLELPGKRPCAYFCITSDQDSAFDFLSSLFLSFVFIRLVRYADKHCADRFLEVPVHILGEELTACGVIPDLSRKISVIRSRNISMSCVFQNLAGLQNRYPYNQWQEILGCCDYQLALAVPMNLRPSLSAIVLARSASMSPARQRCSAPGVFQITRPSTGRPAASVNESC
jgi:type IV secretion system protein VirD4